MSTVLLERPSLLEGLRHPKSYRRVSPSLQAPSAPTLSLSPHSCQRPISLDDEPRRHAGRYQRRYIQRQPGPEVLWCFHWTLVRLRTGTLQQPKRAPARLCGARQDRGSRTGETEGQPRYVPSMTLAVPVPFVSSLPCGRSRRLHLILILASSHASVATDLTRLNVLIPSSHQN